MQNSIYNKLRCFYFSQSPSAIFLFLHYLTSQTMIQHTILIVIQSKSNIIIGFILNKLLYDYEFHFHTFKFVFLIFHTHHYHSSHY